LKYLLILELLAPRWLEVAWKLPIVLWQPQEVCNCKSKIVEHSIYCLELAISVREERIERDPKALVTYLNNVDVGQP
jgi:hypothetical protein